MSAAKAPSPIDYDAQIAEVARQLKELERLKAMHGKKKQAVGKMRAELDRLLSEYHLEEREFFAIISEPIVAWLKASTPAAGMAGPSYWEDLAKHFAQHAKSTARTPPAGAAKGKKRKGAVPEDDTPKTLPTGLYYNPHTGQRVEKIRRATRELQGWIQEYGFDTVATWRQ